jgi:general secretion pathway protein A
MPFAESMKRYRQREQSVFTLDLTDKYSYKEGSVNTSVAIKDEHSLSVSNYTYSLYTDFFGLTENPFSLTPDPRYFYLSAGHKEALAHLYYGLHEKQGFIAITGEVGTGKTTLCRAFLEQIAPEYEVAYIFNPCLTAIELLQSINKEFALPSDIGFSKKDLLDRLNEFLLEKNREGKTVIVIIDEAQNLEPEVLEQIRLISNLETNTTKLIQIVLIGQPELNDLLSSHELRQLNQRIMVKWDIPPLNAKEIAAYIAHRLKIAGSGSVRFNSWAIRSIYSSAKGNPRFINILTHRSMLIAYAQNCKIITRGIVSKAIRELLAQGLNISARLNSSLYKFALAGLLITLSIVFGFSKVTNYNSKQQSAIAVKEKRVTQSDALLNLLASVSEEESKESSKQAIIPLWGLADNEGKELLVYDLTGTLDTVRRFNLPVILELNVKSSKRYVPLLRIESENAIVRFNHKEWKIPFQELQMVWNGHGQIYWKDFENLKSTLTSGDTGIDVKWLQLNLQNLGFFPGEPSSVYDENTKQAVLAFQQSKALNADGVFGTETKMLFYGALSKTYSVPGLVQENIK